MTNLLKLFLLLFCLILPMLAVASDSSVSVLDLTSHWIGYTAIGVFSVAYILVILEEKIHLRKSKPVLLAAGIIWILIALAYNAHGIPDAAEHAIRHYFLEYAELFFFLLVGMTYINAMIERGVFDELRKWLVSKEFTYRSLFWITGMLAFFISPVAQLRCSSKWCPKNLKDFSSQCSPILEIAPPPIKRSP